MVEKCRDAETGEKGDYKQITVEIDNGLELKGDAGSNRVAENIAYRHRFLHTACVCFSMFSLGWRNGLVGPTFPDLQLITNEDLSTASWIFTAISFGGLLGSVCGGFAYDRFNKIGVFMVIVYGLGIAAGIAPWCSNFVAMFIIHVLHGAFASALDTAATADMTVIWRHKAGPYMQAVHGIFSVGAIISPFVSEPFLARKIYAEDERNVSLSNSSLSLFGISTSTIENHEALLDSISAVSRPVTPGYSIIESSTNVYNPASDASTSTLRDLTIRYGETFIYIPYFSATFVCLIAASLYLVVYCLFGSVYNLRAEKVTSSVKIVSHREYFLSKKMKIVFTVLLALTLTFYVMSERSFIGFLMTFVITELQWSKASGSSGSAAFWIAFAAGRLSGIIIVKCFNLSAVIFVFFLIITFGASLFWIAVIYSMDVLVWISIATVGYGMSVIFASIFLWLSENIRRLTGKMASILFIFFSSGAMVFPILVGYLMDKVSKMWFIYLQLILFSAMCTLYIFVLVMFNVLKKRHENSLKERLYKN